MTTKLKGVDGVKATELTIYTSEDLVEFNEMLLQRGVPIERDNIGYNKPDYTVCSNYFNALTDAQKLDLADRIVKYCNTQLSADSNVMKNTVKYYEQLTSKNEAKNSISLDFGENMTMISFKYNYDFIKAVKTIKGRKYNPQEKKWYVPNDKILIAIDNLEQAGANVEGLREVVQEKINIKQDTKPEPIVNKITAKEVDNKIVINFDYNPSIVNAVKSLPRQSRKYNPSEKTWTVDKTVIFSLINDLKAINNIDYSEIKKYAVNNQEKQEQKPELKTLIVPEGMKINPYKHQLEAGQFLLNKKKAICADEMGGGKTISSILAGYNVTGKKLIVCPASLKLNWQKEINFIPNQTTTVINGKGWIDSEGWTIINYDILKKNINNILKANFSCVIFDEIHYGKAVDNKGNPTSNRAKCFLEIAKKCEYAFLLTGTPITNKTKDIYNSLVAVNHPLTQRGKWSFFNFGKTYCNGYNNGYGWNFDGSSNKAELHELIKPYMIRRLKKEMLDLPEKIRSFIPVDINLRSYNAKVKEYMRARREKAVDNKGEHLVYLNALRTLLAKEKVSKTIEVTKDILEQGEQVVIMTNYKYVVEKCMEEFGADAVKLTGDTNQSERQKAVEQFQNGTKKVFVGNIIASGVGITLTKACNIVVNDFDWIPANHAQAEDRIHRIGQTQDCNIKYIFANDTFDNKMAELLETKLNNISQIIDGKEEQFADTDIINAIIDSF